MVGDDDLFSMDHNLRLCGAIPNSEFAVVPGTSHALVWEKPAIVSRLALDFLESETVTTLLPIRRAATERRPHVAGSP